MIRFLVCDDNLEELAEIEQLLKEQFHNCTIASFSTSNEALLWFHKRQNIDIAILDIMMPSLSGTQLAANLRQEGFTGQILFLTFSNDFAYESYQVNASNYLLKPIKKHELIMAVEQAQKKQRSLDQTGLMIYGSGWQRFIRFSELLFVEVRNHNLYFTLIPDNVNQNKTVLKIYATLKEYLPFFEQEPRMGRCHTSFYVNMDWVDMLTPKDVIIRGEIRIPITRKYAKFRERYAEWMFQERNNV